MAASLAGRAKRGIFPVAVWGSSSTMWICRGRVKVVRAGEGIGLDRSGARSGAPTTPAGGPAGLGLILGSRPPGEGGQSHPYV